MRVAHLIHGLGLGGAQKVVASLVASRAGADPGEPVLVYAPLDGELRSEIEGAGARVRLVERQRSRLDRRWARDLAARFLEDRVEILHTHLFGDTLHGLLALRLLEGPKCPTIPIVGTLHSARDFYSRLQRLGYRWALPRCDAVVACSDAVRASFSSLEAACPASCLWTTIPNGIPDPGSPRRAAFDDPEELRLIWVGRLESTKRLDLLLDALARLEASGPGIRVSLELVGDGSLRESVEERATDLGLAGSARGRVKVAFAGFRSDVAAHLERADAIVFSSDTEGLSIALLEAMAAARAVVTTEVPGIIEAARADHEALVVPRGDASALAGAIGRLASDADLGRRLASASRARFEERYGADAMCRAHDRLYRGLQPAGARGRHLL